MRRKLLYVAFEPQLQAGKLAPIGFKTDAAESGSQRLPIVSRSARLRDFLLYVGMQSLKDGCPEIHEQEIGAKVFGRPLTYDRSQDNIVRVNATELRKRIESYFATEGAAEPLILEIPHGGYKPVFQRRA